MAALEGGIIDGIVTDMPTAWYMSGVQLTDGILVGQLPSDGGAQEQFGLVFEKGSALTACVSASISSLEAEDVFTALLKQWIPDIANAPVLK